MSASEQKIVQYLNEAHAMEQGLVRVLQAQIAMAPRGQFRQDLERHLRETERHADRVRSRLSDLDGASNPIALGIGLVQTVLGQAVALGKAPLDLLRGTAGEEKILKNAKDACAAESLEIATYTALERLADSVGDDRTAELARSICEDEERMLDRLLEQLPLLTDGVVASEIRGEDTFALSETGAADTARAGARAAKRKGQRARKRAAGAAKHAGSSAKRSAGRATSGSGRRTSSASRGTSSASRSGRSRSTAAQRRSSGAQGGSNGAPRPSDSAQGGRAGEPWPGYDDLNVGEVRAALDNASAQRARRVRTYEKAHKDRTGVVEKAESDLSGA